MVFYTMKKLNFNKLKGFLPFVLLLIAIICCNLAIADVGNNNRYNSGGDGGFSGDGDIGALIGYLIGLFIDNPTVGLIVLVIFLVLFFII